MMGEWTVFSNHGHVLVCLARKNDARLRDVAVQVGITERAVQKIVKDLQDAGFIEVRKQGRCNRYRINRRKSLRHSLESQCTVGKLLSLIAPPGSSTRRFVEEPLSPEPLETAAESPPPEPEPETQETTAENPQRAPAPKEMAAETPLPAEKEEAAAEKPVDEQNEKRSENGSANGPVDVRQQGSLF